MAVQSSNFIPAFSDLPKSKILKNTLADSFNLAQSHAQTGLSKISNPALAFAFQRTKIQKYAGCVSGYEKSSIIGGAITGGLIGAGIGFKIAKKGVSNKLALSVLMGAVGAIGGAGFGAFIGQERANKNCFSPFDN